MERLVKIYPHAALDAEHLIKRGLLREQESSPGCYALLSTGLEGWIMREMATDPGEQATEVTVNDWLKSGRMTMNDPEKDLLTKVKKQYWPLLAMLLKEVSFEMMGKVTVDLLLRSFV